MFCSLPSAPHHLGSQQNMSHPAWSIEYCNNAKKDTQGGPYLYLFSPTLNSAKTQSVYMMHRRMIERMTLKVVIIYVCIPIPLFLLIRAQSISHPACMVHRRMMVRNALKVAIITFPLSPPSPQLRVRHILHVG
jgi:hypothetical protein